MNDIARYDRVCQVEEKQPPSGKKQYGNTSDIYTVTKISLISDDLQMGGALFEPETIAGIKRPQPWRN